MITSNNNFASHKVPKKLCYKLAPKTWFTSVSISTHDYETHSIQYWPLDLFLYIVVIINVCRQIQSQKLFIAVSAEILFGLSPKPFVFTSARRHRAEAELKLGVLPAEQHADQPIGAPVSPAHVHLNTFT